jgi:hypothetical protein
MGGHKGSYKVKVENLPLLEVYEVFKDGTEVLRATFKSVKFVPIGE